MGRAGVFLHVYSLLGTHATPSSRSARLKQGPTLRMRCVIASIIASRPLRHPSARNGHLAGCPRLGARLPPSEFQRGAVGLQVQPFQGRKLLLPQELVKHAASKATGFGRGMGDEKDP